MEINRNRLAEAIRLGLFAGIFAGIGAGFASPVLAQDEGEDQTDQEQEEDSADLSRVTVTGSRIERAGLDTFYPAITVDRQLLEDRAYTNIAEALNEIPTFGNPDVTPQGVQNGFSVGQNFVDFLGLGAQRTLTLVNGRRFVSANVPSIFGESGGLQVDFNVIPVAMVERIETVGIGGAPIYGSDAIAGTINVITRDRYEGAEFTVRHGFTSKGDAEFENVMMIAGANTADGKGNVTFSAEWFRQEGLLGTARPRFSAGENDVFFGTTEPNRAEFFRNQRINLFTFGGLIHAPGTGLALGPGFSREIPVPSFGIGALPDGVFYQFDSNSNLVPFTPGAPGPGSIFFALGGDGPDFFDRVDQLQSPLDRGVFTGQFNYDLTNNVRFSSDFLFSDSNSTELTNQGGFQTGAFTGTSAALVFDADHPFLPQQARDVLAENGLDSFVLSRFNNDIIDSSNDRDQQLWRWTGGFDGDFFIGNRRFNWEAFAVHGESDIETQAEGIIDGRFLNAIDVRRLSAEDLAQVDPTDLATIGGQGNVGAGDVVCESVFQAALDPNFGTVGGNGVQSDRLFIDGCIPLNLFGEGARSEAAREWVTGDRLTNTKIQQTVWNFNVGGELFDLPAGPLAVNVGYEGRRERAVFTPGLGTELPVTRSAPFAETGGEFDTDEVFFEGVAPILSEDMNIPGFHTLEINGAVREIDNSQSGSSTVWSAGGNWKPIRTLNVRGNYTESIRAPSLVELFAPVTTSFSFANDPCDFRFVDQGPNPEQRRANCIAAGIDDPDDFTSNVVNATAQGLSGGNPNLTDEQAESWSIGFTWEPRWVDNLIIGADHFDVELADAITALTLEDLLVACFDSTNFPNNSACNAFERNAAGQVVDFQSGQTNAESFRVEVQDFFVDYRFEVANALGVFSEGMRDSNLGFLRLNTRISRDRRRQQSVTGEAIVRASRSFTAPKYQGTFDLTWSRNDTRVFWRTIWQNRARLDDEQQTAFFNEEGEQVTSTSHRFISNLTISQALPRWFDWMPQDTRAQLVVNNVFRRMPDRVEQAANDFGFAELFGRQYSLTLQVRY
ncbi:MAG: TonB-dependent receptor [Wenzhouxiangellaceae bacterium]